MRQYLFAFLMCIVAVTPARAQTPEDIIRWLYTSLTSNASAEQQGLYFLSAPAQRSSYFSARMVAFYDANDTYSDDPYSGCVDFNMAIPGNDYDADEVVRSLAINTQENDRGGLTVQATFTNFGEAARVDYDFVNEAGFWKIDDIAGAHFRVSQIDCQAKQAAPSQVAATGYCYQRDYDNLRLQVLPDGDAILDFISWQGNAHTCSTADMAGEAVTGGWDFHDAQGCRIQLRVGADGAIGLSDPEWVCKPMFCGQRAVIDGISFPAASQIDCAAWQRLQN